MKLIWGTANFAAVTTGVIDIRGTLGGSAVKVPYRVIAAKFSNATTNTAPAELFSENGTLAVTVTSSDTGNWFFLCQ